MKRALFLLFLCTALKGFSSAVPDFDHLDRCEGVVILLTTPRSGSNSVAGSLSGATRKPISFLGWEYEVFDPASKRREHPGYNRLGLPLISDQPVVYRTHFEFVKLRQIPSSRNQLIFVTRNPKELLFRAFFLHSPSEKTPDLAFIKSFFQNYLEAFKLYHRWNAENRQLVFYEDFIERGEEILLDLLEFMGEETTYFEDFIQHREEYNERLLGSYAKQHGSKLGGRSSSDGPKAIHYTKDISTKELKAIDQYLEKAAPVIWNKYLKRFQTP